jgi:hypothetical protein
MKHDRPGWMFAGIAVLSLQAHAGGDPDSRSIAPPKRIPDPVAEPLVIQPAGDPVATASMPLSVRRAVVADAARRFQVAESAVVLAHAEQVTWSDGSLGCPQPGMSYTQALVPGYRVTATTAAGQMLYHTDTRGHVVTCAQRARPAGPVTQPPRTPGPDR